MSGNSDCSLRQTAPIVCSRSDEAVVTGVAGAAVAGTAPRSAPCGAAHVAGTRSGSFRQEDQPVLPDLQLVPVPQLGALDPPAVQERAVQAALVLDVEAAVALDEHRVLARDRDVVEEDVAVRRAADHGAL